MCNTICGVGVKSKIALFMSCGHDHVAHHIAYVKKRNGLDVTQTSIACLCHLLKEMEAALFCVVICLQLVILCILGYGVRDYIRLKHLVRILKRLIVQMDSNELLAQLMEEERPADTAPPPTAPIPIETVSSRDINHKRARFAALAAVRAGQNTLCTVFEIQNTKYLI